MSLYLGVHGVCVYVCICVCDSGAREELTNNKDTNSDMYLHFFPFSEAWGISHQLWLICFSRYT